MLEHNLNASSALIQNKGLMLGSLCFFLHFWAICICDSAKIFAFVMSNPHSKTFAFGPTPFPCVFRVYIYAASVNEYQLVAFQ